MANIYCSSAEDIVGLHFTLVGPAIIVGPKIPIEPASKISGRVLEALLELGRCDQITIYFPQHTIDKERLTLLPTQVKSAQATNTDLNTLYTGNGGRILRSREDVVQPHVLPTEGPADGRLVVEDGHLGDPVPTYEQAVSSKHLKRSNEAAISPTEQPAKRQTPASRQTPPSRQMPSSGQAPSSGETPVTTSILTDLTDQSLGIRAWKLAVVQQLVFLTSQVASMQHEKSLSSINIRDTADVAVQTERAVHVRRVSPNSTSTSLPLQGAHSNSEASLEYSPGLVETAVTIEQVSENVQAREASVRIPASPLPPQSMHSTPVVSFAYSPGAIETMINVEKALAEQPALPSQRLCSNVSELGSFGTRPDLTESETAFLQALGSLGNSFTSTPQRARSNLGAEASLADTESMECPSPSMPQGARSTPGVAASLADTEIAVTGKNTPAQPVSLDVPSSSPSTPQIARSIPGSGVSLADTEIAVIVENTPAQLVSLNMPSSPSRDIRTRLGHAEFEIAAMLKTLSGLNTQARKALLNAYSPQSQHSTCSTVEASLQDRLDEMEAEVFRHRKELPQIQAKFDRLDHKLTETIRGLKAEVELCSHQVTELDEQFTQFQSGVSREIDDKLDEMITGAKSELQDCMKEDMDNAESNIKDAITENKIQLTWADM